MLKSMTAFARTDTETTSGILTWELRSVNHRYLEPCFRLPDLFREAEPQLRESLRKYLSRGKVDCVLKWQYSPASAEGLPLNDTILSGLSIAAKKVSACFENAAPIDVMAVLQWPGVIDTESADRKQLCAQAVSAFECALEIMLANRQREGAQLAPLFEQRLLSIAAIVASVQKQLPEILNRQSDLIRKRFEDASVELDSTRLEQEMVMLAQKSDVAEELERLHAHVKEVRQVLQSNEPVGRRLDFLMQELNREANTLSSKSIVTDTTKAAVELKVLIEQMREQVQNVE